MNAYVRYSPMEGAHEIHLFDRHFVYSIGRDGRLVGTPRVEGAGDTPPALLLDTEVVEPLLRELGKVVQSSDATLEALADTRATRDRLLTLVEKVVNDG